MANYKRDKIINVVYSVGAAVVILGALFKINHISFLGLDGSTLLAIGLITEALIFFFSAFIPPAKDYEWEKAYPQLASSGKISSNMSDTISSLSAMQATQLENAKKQIEMNQKTIDDLMSVGKDSEQLTQELNKLTENINNLNKVYGGMLTAMKH